MTVNEERMQELENIKCIREFRERMESLVLSGELSVSDRTINEYIYEVWLFHRQSKIPFDEIPDKTRAIKWKREVETKYAKKTLGKKLSAINHYLRLYHEVGWYLPLPKNIKRVREPIPLSEATIFDMVRHYEKRNKPTKAMLIYIGYLLSARAEALLGIKLDDIDSGARTILLRRTKQDKSRTVPMSRKAMQKVTDYIEKSRPSPKDPKDAPYLFIQEIKRNRANYGYVRFTVRQVAMKLGIESQVCTHILRHSRIKELRSRGYGWEKVMTLSGHGSLRSLADYIHAETVENLQEALDEDEGTPAPVTTQPQGDPDKERLLLENEKLKLELQVLRLEMQCRDTFNPEKSPKHNIGYM